MTTYFRSYQPKVTKIVAIGTLPPCRVHNFGKVRKISTTYRVQQCQDCGYKITTWVKTH